MDTGNALVNSVEGLGKSTVLGIKDIVLLIVAILKVIIKYAKCIISFALTTVLGGCAFMHLITLLFYILYLIFPITAFLVYLASGLDIMPLIDAFFDMISEGDDKLAETIGFNLTKWPKPIHMWCYTCFFEEVKLKDVLKDIMVVKDVGDMIQYDFNKTMPKYFRPAKIPAISAKKNLDAVFS
jgi:hypothetical protein